MAKKVKVHRVPPSLDMTPMVDLAFLLVTFFMLTTKFAPEEPVVVDMPSSISEIKLPEIDILTISVDKNNTIFFNLDGKYARERLINEMGKKYNVSFTPDEIHSFSVLSSIGVPMGSLKQYLSMDSESRKTVKQPGIPADSLHNELADWIVFARLSNPKVRIAIKGDRKATYPVVKKIINTLQANRISRFNLITDLEKGS
jgi:biopolymer transport protein ExbD